MTLQKVESGGRILVHHLCLFRIFVPAAEVTLQTMDVGRIRACELVPQSLAEPHVPSERICAH
jgi:hypothetical protein